MQRRTICTPEAQLCAPDKQADVTLVRSLGACGVECRGDLAEVTRDRFGCGLIGAITREHMRRAMLEYDLPTPGFDASVHFASNILEGRTTPQEAFDGLYQELTGKTPTVKE